MSIDLQNDQTAPLWLCGHENTYMEPQSNGGLERTVQKIERKDHCMELKEKELNWGPKGYTDSVK